MADIGKVLEIDKEIRPNFYRHAEEIAKIIDPVPFTKINMKSSSRMDQKVYETTRAYQRARAISTAVAVMRYLGIATETDWITILHTMSRREHDG